MIQVQAYGQFWWVADDAMASNPVELFREETDASPLLIVPRQVVRHLSQVPEPSGVGVPVWDANGRVWFKRHDTGDWVAPTATGFDSVPWSSVTQPVSMSPPGLVRMPTLSGDEWRLLFRELRRLVLWVEDNRDTLVVSEVQDRLRRILRGHLG